MTIEGHFASMKTLEINPFVQLINLHDSWLTKSILKGKAYELNMKSSFVLYSIFWVDFLAINPSVSLNRPCLNFLAVSPSFLLLTFLLP